MFVMGLPAPYRSQRRCLVCLAEYEESRRGKKRRSEDLRRRQAKGAS